MKGNMIVKRLIVVRTHASDLWTIKMWTWMVHLHADFRKCQMILDKRVTKPRPRAAHAGSHL